MILAAWKRLESVGGMFAIAAKGAAMRRVEIYQAFLTNLRSELIARAATSGDLGQFADCSASWPKHWVLPIRHSVFAGLKIGFHRSHYFHRDGDHSSVFLTVSVPVGSLCSRARTCLMRQARFARSTYKDALYAERQVLASRTDDANVLIMPTQQAEHFRWTMCVLQQAARCLS